MLKPNLRRFPAIQIAKLGIFFVVLTGLNGCVVRLAQAVSYKNQVDKAVEDLKVSRKQCDEEMRAPELDPIRQKVELYWSPIDKDPPPFIIAANDAFPSDADRTVIAKWASMRDVCIRRDNALRATPDWTNAENKMHFQRQMSIGVEFHAQITALIVDLYQQKLTYAEFAQKQHSMGRETMTAELAYTQAIVERDDDRETSTYEMFLQNKKNWTDYVQQVSARAPNTKSGNPPAT